MLRMNVKLIEEHEISEVPNGRLGVGKRQGCNSNPAVVRPVDPMDAGQPSFFRAQPGVVGVKEKKALTLVDVGIGHHLIDVGLAQSRRHATGAL